MAHIGGNQPGFVVETVNVDTAISTAHNNHIVCVSAGASDINISLVNAATLPSGVRVILQRKSTSTSDVVIGAPISKTLDDATDTCELITDGSTWLELSRGSSASGDSCRETIVVTHAFTAGDIVYRKSDSTWAKAKADAEVTAEVVGIVESVSTTVSFVVVYTGKITIVGASWTDGAVYFLSDATAGLLTATEPSTVGRVSRPVMVATGATTGIVMQHRGMVIPSDQYLTEDVLVHQWLGV
jgi:hypothetical protein